jgi:hypothetical protein
VIEHPMNSWLWEFPLARWLQELPGVYFTVSWNCCYGGDRIKGSALLHNCGLPGGPVTSPTRKCVTQARPHEMAIVFCGLT